MKEEIKKDFDTIGPGYSKSNIQTDVKNNVTSNDISSIQQNLEKSKDYYKFSELEAKELSWLWYPYLIKGNINIIVGDGGVGKSYLIAWLLSAISKGDKIPFSDSNFNIGDSILQNAEDDLQATVLPRLLLNCADVDKIGFFNEEDKILSIKKIKRLEDKIKEIRPEIVVLDPIQAYIGNVNINSAVEVRNALKPLKMIAEKYICAIVMLMHLNKSTDSNKAANRVMGSYDFIASCRSAFLVEVNPENSEERLLIPIKTNLTKESEKNSLSFKITEAGKIEWIENKGKINPDEVLLKNNNSSDKNSNIKSFIIVALSKGDLLANDLKAMAR